MAHKAMRARLRGIVNNAVLVPLRDFRANYVTPRKVVRPTAGDGDGQGIPDHEIANWESSGDADCYLRYKVARLAPHLDGAVLEVGSQTGELGEMLLDALPSKTTRLILSEPNPAWLKRLRGRFPEEPVVLNLDLVERPLGLQVDSVLAVNVFGCIEREVTALANAVKMLRPGGRLVIWEAARPKVGSESGEGAGRPEPYAEYDEKVGRVRRYRLEDLEGCLRAAGLEVELCRYVNPLGAVFGRLGVSRMRDEADPRLVRLYDRLVVPVSRGLDHLPFSRRLFGQNIVAVARKAPQAPKGLSIPHQRRR